MRTRQKGFTLIELMIVVAIIALIAAFAIPALLRARMTANETGAIAGLRSLVSNQATFQSVCVVDQDEDGTGEFGLFEELAGTGQPRAPLSGNPAPAQRIPGEFMAQVFGNVNTSGYAQKSGYMYVLYLPNVAGGGWDPSADGAAVDTDPVATAGAVDVDACDDQEVFWIAYSWPVMRGRTGNRVFCVSGDGTIMFTKNDDLAPAQYSGSAAASAPASNAALDSGSTDIRWPVAEDAEDGFDTNMWYPLSN